MRLICSVALYMQLTTSRASGSPLIFLYPFDQCSVVWSPKRRCIVEKGPEVCMQPHLFIYAPKSTIGKLV